MARVFNEGSRWDRKRELKDRMLAWLAAKLGVGPSLGNVYYVAVADSLYEANLLGMGIKSSEIVHSLAAGEDLLTTGQNDVLCVAGGSIITETAECDWDKSMTHLVGLGGPQKASPDVGTGFTNATATVGAVIHNTGTGNQFHDITLTNAGAGAAALTAFKNAGPGTFLKGCQIVGMMGATACDTTLASSLEIAINGYYFQAEDCVFGTSDYQAQGSDTNGVLLFSCTTSSSRPSDGLFRNCKFNTQIAAATRCMIYMASEGLDRDWTFDNCIFYAFATNHAVAMNQVLGGTCGSTHDITFKHCAGINITAWKTDTDGCTWTIEGDSTVKGGVGIAST
jgi:hypothetical protein